MGYSNVAPEFDDDDMNATLSSDEKAKGWHYPLTKTEQLKEFGCVVAEQERFLMRLQDGHADVVKDYLENPKKKAALDLDRLDEWGWAPLHYATTKNHPEIVQALLEAEANPNMRDGATEKTA